MRLFLLVSLMLFVIVIVGCFYIGGFKPFTVFSMMVFSFTFGTNFGIWLVGVLE